LKLKNPLGSGFFNLMADRNRHRHSLDLGFLIGNMLANDRIELFHLQLFWRSPLVLGRGVKMPRTRGGNQLDFVTHGNCSLNFFAPATQFSKNSVNAFFVNDAHSMAGHAQAHETPFAFDPEPMDVQVGQKAPAGSVIGVRDIISSDWALTRHLTDSGHRITLQRVMTGFMTLVGL